jgi:hypothetical protein
MALAVQWCVVKFFTRADSRFVLSDSRAKQGTSERHNNRLQHERKSRSHDQNKAKTNTERKHVSSVNLSPRLYLPQISSPLSAKVIIARRRSAAEEISPLSVVDVLCSLLTQK